MAYDDFDTIGPGSGAGDPMDITSGGGAAASGGGSALGGLTGGIGLAGLGVSVYGQVQQSKDEKTAYGSRIAQAQLDEQVNSQRQRQMELTYNRNSLENLRKTQQTNAMALATSTNQGAQFGSGAAGGRAQVTSAGAFNQLGMNQNYQIGENIFGLDNQIDEQKINEAKAQSAANSAGGIAAIGGDITKAAPMLASLALLAL